MKTEYPVGFDNVLRERFRYTPESGLLEQCVNAQWRPVKRVHPHNGHVLAATTFKGKIFQLPAARVAFFLHKGRWPSRLSFKDGNNKNLAFANLVEADRGEIKYERVQVGPTPYEEEQPTVGSSVVSTARLPAPSRNYYGEMMEAVAQQQRWEQRCMAASPLEQELDTLIAKATEEWEQRRWQDGLVTGYSLREVMLFFEASTYMLPPRSAEWCYMEYKRRKLSGTEAEEGKLVHDQLYSGFLLYAVDKNILSREQANLLLSNYRWRGQQVTNSLSAYLATLEREFLAKHGYTTRAAIREEVVKRLRDEEAERNHQALWADEGVPAALWVAQVLAAEDDQLDPPAAAVLESSPTAVPASP